MLKWHGPGGPCGRPQTAALPALLISLRVDDWKWRVEARLTARLPAPANNSQLPFSGCDSRAGWPPPRHMCGCDSRRPHQSSLSELRPGEPVFFIRRAPACAAEPPKLCGLGAAPRRRANLKFQISNLGFENGVVADKQCTCPASKLMWERYPPTPPFYCGENEIQAGLISPVFVGATPTPATNCLRRATKGSAPAAGL